MEIPILMQTVQILISLIWIQLFANVHLMGRLA